jgi:hypothetical protein
MRFWSLPVQLGQVLPSTFKVMSLSVTVYVPNKAMLPCTTALLSSAVPSLRLSEANFGSSARILMIAKRPLLSKT